MPFINLIQDQRLALRREQAKSRTALFICTGVTCFSLVGCGFLFIVGEALDHEIGRMKQEAAKVKPIQKELADVNGMIASMEPKLKTLENAQELTSKWDRILEHLTVQTPKELWLTQVRCTAGDPTKPIEVNLQGMGQQLQTIGEFILRMQSSKDLEGVALKSTQEKMVASSTGIEFDVVASVAGTVEEQKTKKQTDGEESK